MSDLIDRQVAIESIERYFGDLPIQGRFDILSIIKQLPTASRWIPVTERLPEENKPVLVTHHGKYQAFVSVDWIDPHTHEWNRTCNVTAWQHLPEPWKGEDDEKR